MNWTWFLFSFEGRINRAKFWLAAFMWFATTYSFMTLFTWIVMGILLATGRHSRSSETSPWFHLSVSPLGEVEFVPHSAGPSPGAHVKRGHD